MTPKIICIALLLACLVDRSFQQGDEASTAVEGSNLQGNDMSIRLPKSLTPIHYLVRLQPFINGNFTFNGFVEITFEPKESTNKIVLHMADIITRNETAKVYVTTTPNTLIPITSQTYDNERQFYVVTLGETLTVGNTYIFCIKFVGLLNDDLKGFYRSTFKDDEGNTKYLATTQFEPTDARRAFPCFDEPAFKAKFTIEIAREEGMRTISNMPRVDAMPIPGKAGWFLDRFNTTFPMSTYLVAFIVSDFEHLDANTTDKYEFRVWARKNALSRGSYAVELGPKVSRFYEEFFGVPFPLPKQDMAAVPDFSAGAMENWGLIIYRESSFLFDPKVAKASDKFRVATIIAHELAHQWFGNLVSPAWWTDLWLNEGFASYMEYLGLRDTEAMMKPLDQFVVIDFFDAMSLDCLETSHPISIPVGNPDEINAIFDTISYAKGASILRMMSSFLTEETFKHGLGKYLTELSYSNAEQDDLWRYLTNQAHTDGTLDSNMTVKEVMDTWTLQMGYPVLTVHKNTDGTATFTQERFLLVKTSNTSTDDHDYKWWIPITFTTKTSPAFEDTAPRDWMSPSETTKVIQGLPSTQEWFIVNLGRYGYYRVNYDPENWEAIASQLVEDPTVFPDVNRAQIIDDSMNLARAGLLPYDTVLNLLTYLNKEKEYVPIKAALNNLLFIKEMLAATGGYGVFKNYLLSFIVPLYDEVKFEDSSSDLLLEQRKRETVLTLACELGHPPCINASIELYAQWMRDPENTSIISPNLKSIVYCTAIREGGPKEWKFAWDRYIQSHIGTEQKELLVSMGCSEDIWVLGEYLNRTLTPDRGIKKQVLRYIIPSIAENSVGKYVSWQFLRNQWGKIIDYFGSVSFVLDDILSAVTASLNTEVELDELNAFKEKYAGRFSSAARSIEQAGENVKNNIEWMNNYYDVIINWLEKNGYQNEI